ncbi:hypothetical protein HEP_00532000, partial [Hepatocystis sp. ex Piliocolobus tephrosceles]
FISWLLNLYELLPKINIIHEQFINKLNLFENNYLEAFEKAQYINYELLYAKKAKEKQNKNTYKNNNVSCLSNIEYKIPLHDIRDYLFDSNLKRKKYYTNGYDIDCTDRYNDLTQAKHIDLRYNDYFFILTDKKKTVHKKNNIISIYIEKDINDTIKNILLHENYFFNYTFKQMNKNKNIKKLLFTKKVSGIENTSETINTNAT